MRTLVFFGLVRRTHMSLQARPVAADVLALLAGEALGKDAYLQYVLQGCLGTLQHKNNKSIGSTAAGSDCVQAYDFAG